MYGCFWQIRKKQRKEGWSQCHSITLRKRVKTSCHTWYFLVDGRAVHLDELQNMYIYMIFHISWDKKVESIVFNNTNRWLVVSKCLKKNNLVFLCDSCMNRLLVIENHVLVHDFHRFYYPSANCSSYKIQDCNMFPNVGGRILHVQNHLP